MPRKKYTIDTFVQKANEVHNYKYDYSEVIYITSDKKIKINCTIHGIFEQTPASHLAGSGCIKCSREASRSTTAQFIEKANGVHNNKYDYSISNYLGNKVKIEIKCLIHGIFSQWPNDHLNGSGCNYCAGYVKKTTQQFINEATKIHNNKYDYSLVNYKNNNIKIIIICKIHGEFEMLPYNHLYGQGCSPCADKINADKRRTGIDAFIKKANEIHNNKYTYIGPYTNTMNKIQIQCPKHGIFEQAPHSHLNGKGCMACANEARSVSYSKGKDLFVEQANVIHNNKYKYPGEYINTHIHIEIECPDHGIFRQAPVHHLHAHGCPKCSNGPNVSKQETQWLDHLNVPEEYRQKILWIDNKRIKTDAFDPTNNIVYEFYGDFWHGNPNKYNANDINKMNKRTFGELYQATIDRENMLKRAGYNIVFIWEENWKRLKNE